jgi:class 3 adenylate cyclase
MPEERKLVTVLFADVTGSTALGEELDPEDVRALMGRYYDHAKRVVSDHGGRLEKFIGDAAMAVFGLPHARGDDAQRAVAAALALREAVDVDSVLGDQIALRVGVNTGEVVATTDESAGDFLVTGDAVNVAARLQQSANPSEILISDRTQTATRGAFLFDEPRELTVKGKREVMRVFPVVGVKTVQEVERPPFVGRKQELAQLSLLRSWALEENRPQLVSILAPAGTGKTRVLEEFLLGLPTEEGWKVGVGRCLPYGQTLTYWPLRGLLEDLLGGVDRDLVVDAFLRGGCAGADASRLADYIVAPLGIESEVLAEREDVFNTWRLLLETLAGEAPRVIVFEDLHWASESLLDLVEHLMHPRTQAPLILMAISRPELLDRRPSWGAGGRENFTTLVLKPLNEAQTESLVRHLGADLPENVQDQIVHRSGGNPFFATELVRYLGERASGEVGGQEAVPDTVHAAVLARLDALSPTERRVLQTASVSGRSFRPATLESALVDLNQSEIDSALDALVARDFAVPGQGDTYTFRHALIRDVAYGTLSRAERIRMHAAVAAWLEGFAAGRLDEFVELIAYHYREAVALSRRSASPLPLPFGPEKAVRFLERAGEIAGSSGAVVEARTHLESAIEIAPSNERPRLYEKVGDVTVGDAGTDAYGHAIQLWRAGADPDPLIGARLLRKTLIARMRWEASFTGRLSEQEMEEMRDEARRLAEAAGNEAELWRVKVVDLFWPMWRNRMTDEELAEGRLIGTSAAKYFEKRQEWEPFHEALDGYGALALMKGQHAEMSAAARRRLASPAVNRIDRGDAVSVLVWSSLNGGEYVAAADAMEREMRSFRPGEPRAPFSNGLSIALLACTLAGQWERRHLLFPALKETWEELRQYAGAGWLLPGFVSDLHMALARQDRPAIDAASSVVKRLLSPDSRVNSRWLFDAYLDDDSAKLELDPRKVLWEGSGVSSQLSTLGIMFLSERRSVLPQNVLEQAAAQASAKNLVPALDAIRVQKSLASNEIGRLVETLDLLEDHGLVPHAARMRVVQAEMSQDPAPLEQARPVLKRLHDRLFLTRLEEVAALLGE